MQNVSVIANPIYENWHVWVVTITLIAAAIIDGLMLKVPNWLTFPFIISGWIYSGCCFGLEGLGWSLLGTGVGLALLLPAYAIGGMGAGDVKLLSGVGAWMHARHTLWGFSVAAIVGALLAIIMVVFLKSWKKHASQFWMIVQEILVIRNPNELSKIAADRKNSMLLLPYGIPIAIGCIIYFSWQGMLI